MKEKKKLGGLDIWKYNERELRERERRKQSNVNE
jgi:hypothetical protein